MIIFFQSLLTASFHGSIVILAVMLLRLLLKKTPRKYICALYDLKVKIFRQRKSRRSEGAGFSLSSMYL